MDSTAQVTITGEGSLYRNKIHGGLDDATPMGGSSLRYTIGVDLRDSTFYGLVSSLSVGRNYMMANYPFFVACTDENGNTFGCLTSTQPPEGFIFPYVQLYGGFGLFLGRVFKVNAGPYVSYFSRKPAAQSLGIDSNYYYPNHPKDMYKPLEVGVAASIAASLLLGKHISVGFTGSVGTSLNDLRTSQWKDARAVLAAGNNEYIHLGSQKLTNRYYSFGLVAGYTF